MGIWWVGILVEGNKGEKRIGEEEWKGVVGGGIFYCCSLSWSSLTHHITIRKTQPGNRVSPSETVPRNADGTNEIWVERCFLRVLFLRSNSYFYNRLVCLTKVFLQETPQMPLNAIPCISIIAHITHPLIIPPLLLYPPAHPSQSYL